MHARTNENVDQRLEHAPRDPEFRLQAFGIVGISFPDPLEKLFTVLTVLRRSIYLVHKAVLFAVLFCRPVRYFLYKSLYVVITFGRVLHKIVFDLCHAICRGFDNYFVLGLEIMKYVARTHSASFRVDVASIPYLQKQSKHRGNSSSLLLGSFLRIFPPGV